MDEFFDIPTLIVIGVAIFVLFRLRQVLGSRTGTEKSPLQRAQQPVSYTHLTLPTKRIV